MRCLFVGGPSDGRWFDLETEVTVMGLQPQRHSVQVPNPPPLSSFDPKAPVSEPEDIPVTTYIRAIWTAGPERRFVFARHGLEPADVFDRLLNHYRPGRS